MVRDVATPTIAKLDTFIAYTGPGTSRLPYVTAASDTFGNAKVTITPLSLVHPLLRLPFLTPENTWNLVTARAASLSAE